MGSGFTDKILTAMEKLPKFQFYPPLCQPWHQHSFLDNFAFKEARKGFQLRARVTYTRHN